MRSKDNDALGRRLKTISADLKLYIEKRLELLLLNVGEHFARIMAESVQRITGVLMLSGALVFLLVALALYLGELLNSDSLGYVLVSLPLIGAGIMFYKLRPKSMVETLQSHFENELINAISASEESEEDTRLLDEPKSEEKKETKTAL